VHLIEELKEACCGKHNDPGGTPCLTKRAYDALDGLSVLRAVAGAAIARFGGEIRVGLRDIEAAQRSAEAGLLPYLEKDNATNEMVLTMRERA